MQILLTRRFAIAVVALASVAFPAHALFGMQSTNYKIPFDSVNSGGARSTAGDSVIEDTAGEQGTGRSSSANYVMNAGYQQMAQVYLSISNEGGITLPNINGLSGGTTTGQGEWNVKTDDSAGYAFYVKSGTSPALKSASGSFADYVTTGADPDYEMQVPPSAAAFGMSPEGDDIADRFRDNGALCNVGALDTANKCWDGLATTDKLVAQGAGPNHPDGATTTVKFRAISGANNIQISELYSASITVTVIAL